MLSRIAESMFWIGRYVERADDTARLLQTHLRLLIEDTCRAESDACRNLLALMSVDSVDDPTSRRPAAAAVLRRRGADLDLLLLGRGPRQRPAGPRGDPARAVGVHQHHLAAAADRPVQHRPGVLVPGLGPRPQRPVHRHRPQHHGPRRRLAVPAAGPQPRAGRHDLADGGLRRPAPPAAPTGRRCCAGSAGTTPSCAPTGSAHRRARPPSS